MGITENVLFILDLLSLKNMRSTFNRINNVYVD